MNEMIERPASNLAEDWMFLVFLFCTATLAYTRSSYPARISRLWNSMWNVRIMRQAIREEPNTPRANLLFNVSFYLLASLIVFLTLKRYGIGILGTSGSLMYVLLLTCLVVAYAVKSVGIRVVQMLGHGDFGLTEYEYNIFLMNRGLSLFLLPVAALLAYLPLQMLGYFFVAAAFIFALMVVYRMVRGLLNAASQSLPVFYIFFYICTLEILPMVVCVKALSH
ncbi:MAG: DUF4271 domain-containing protein [Flavobacteriales bacterium]